MILQFATLSMIFSNSRCSPRTDLKKCFEVQTVDTDLFIEITKPNLLLLLLGQTVRFFCTSFCHG